MAAGRIKRIKQRRRRRGAGEPGSRSNDRSCVTIVEDPSVTAAASADPAPDPRPLKKSGKIFFGQLPIIT